MVNIQKKRNYFVDILVIFFGISAWIGITGVYLELPQLVEIAPEAWKLPSYIVIIVQCGNVASLAYILYDKYSPCRINDAHLIYFTLFIGCITAILMAFFYENTIEINGEQKSLPLLIFTFMFAVVGCLSSVLFMPFMGNLRSMYLITYMLGQGMNGFLSSILSLIQGVGSLVCTRPTNVTINNVTKFQNDSINAISEPLFGPKIYFIFVFGMLLISTVAFVLLNELPICRKEWIVQKMQSNDEINSINGSATEYENIPNNTTDTTHWHCNYLLFILAIVSFLNYGILPGIQSFACLPYGTSAYHLTTTLSSIANPLTCLIAMYFTRYSIFSINIQFATTVLLSVIVIVAALESPTPPLATSVIGQFIIVRFFLDLLQT